MRAASVKKTGGVPAAQAAANAGGAAAPGVGRPPQCGGQSCQCCCTWADMPSWPPAEAGGRWNGEAAICVQGGASTGPSGGCQAIGGWCSPASAE